MRTSLDRSAFLVDLAAAAERAELPVEQIHTEYGHDQIEVSLAPDTPVAAVDTVAAARIVIGRVAARHGLRISFSPVPFDGEAGNGAHLHMSLADDDGPLFSGGRAHTACARQAGRRSPGSSRRCRICSASTPVRRCRRCVSSPATGRARRRAGAWRTAKPRCGSSRPHREVRTAPTPNSNSSTRAPTRTLPPRRFLGSALRGIDRGLELPAEIPEDPSKAAQPPTLLPTEQRAVIEAMADSPTAAELLTPEVIEALVAVRRYEMATFGDLSPAETTQALRLAWSC